MASLDDYYDYKFEEDTWNRLADGYAAEQVEMRRVARALRAEITPLNNLFMPIRGLHDSTTWEGNAATESRRKLDTHEDRFGSAVTSINGLASDLDIRAGELAGEESRARGSAAYFERRKESALDEYNEAFNEATPAI